MSNVSNAESFLKNLTRPETWKRIAFMLLFIAAIYIVALLMLVLILAQVLFNLVSGTDNAQLRRVSSELTIYMSQVLNYLSYNSEQRPFPFAPFPQASVRPQSGPAPATETTINKKASAQQQPPRHKVAPASPVSAEESPSASHPEKHTTVPETARSEADPVAEPEEDTEDVTEKASDNAESVAKPLTLAEDHAHPVAEPAVDSDDSQVEETPEEAGIKLETETATTTAQEGASESKGEESPADSVADDEARYVDSARAGFLGGFDPANNFASNKPSVPAPPPLSFAELSARAKARKAEQQRQEKDENDS